MNTSTDSQFVTDQLVMAQPTGIDSQPLPKTVVLQPRGCLDQKQGLAFQATLEQALRQATQTVIVDLLWVEAIDRTGLQMLKAGMQLAATLGKVLSFQPANATVLTVLQPEWTMLRAGRLGNWAEVWHQELDDFLCCRMRQRVGIEPDQESDRAGTDEIVPPLENCVTSPVKNRFAPPADYICPPLLQGQRTA
jgi:anti-anti-sigma regulatory factor